MSTVGAGVGADVCTTTVGRKDAEYVSVSEGATTVGTTPLPQPATNSAKTRAVANLEVAVASRQSFMKGS
jgi:hypothetical protein